MPCHAQHRLQLTYLYLAFCLLSLDIAAMVTVLSTVDGAKNTAQPGCTQIKQQVADEVGLSSGPEHRLAANPVS
jgi:hypothetical protein